MSFELSFSPEFFLAEGEPYDRSDNAVNPDGKPVSVWSAITMMKPAEWASMCADVFPGINPDHVTPEAVLDKIRETDSCQDLSPPVRVYIDEERYHSVWVSEQMTEEEAAEAKELREDRAMYGYDHTQKPTPVNELTSKRFRGESE